MGDHPVSIELDFVQANPVQTAACRPARAARQDEAVGLGTGPERAGNSPKHTQPKGLAA